MKRTTIYDVAERAGVAPSTVSRAFGVPGRVNERTRQRIVAAAAELGYVPSSPPRPPAGRHRTIAMVLSDITNPHFFELIRGAEQRAKAASHTLVLVNAEESPRIELAQIQDLAPKVDGFVLASSRLTDHDLHDLAGKHHVVLLNRELEGLTSVTLDTTSGCRQILEHLASLATIASPTAPARPPRGWVRRGGQRCVAVPRRTASRRVGSGPTPRQLRPAGQQPTRASGTTPPP